MKILLVAINAKYEHEGLAVWYLKAACQNRGIPVDVRQYSINDSDQRIWASLLGEHPDVVAFSCYIWNRELTLNLISDLKKARPGCTVIVGGPEVSYEGSETDFYAYGADLVIKGEGEGIFPPVLAILKDDGIKAARAFLDTRERCQEEMGYLSPFVPEYLNRIKDRIAYIESSRGCPYRCAYCLSSESKGLVLFPLDQVEEDIEALVASGAKVIKFVDRSFNVNEAHSLGVWDFIRRFPREKVTFHFEINPDRLTPAQMESLLTMPAGLVQVEAGIQSVNPDALKEVSRVMNVDKALENLKTLIQKGNIHVHADLIAGLPYEAMESFRHSFNRVYEVRAHHLQLGFLKLIHGTRIRREAEKHGYKYRSYPPYEVIENQYLSSDELLVLKGVEEVIDRTYNSGRLSLTLEYLLRYFNTPFELYDALAVFFREKGLLYQPMSALRLFQLVREFSLGIAAMNSLELDSFIALDYASSLKNTVLPDFLAESEVKVLDPKPVLESILDGGWKKEYRKRFMVLAGSFPLKIGADFEPKGNRIVMDVENIDPISGRAVIKPV